jgi:DNA-binding LytR/AlgR family response regulator
MERLERMLLEMSDSVCITWKADSVIGALEYMRQLDTYDAIVTDVQLADGSCFDLFELFRPLCPVIFVTAYDEYAIEAFVVNAIDYIQKPLKKEQINLAIKKLCTRLNAGGGEIDYEKLAASMSKTYKEAARRFVIRFGEQMRVVGSDEIAYISTVHKSVFATLHNGKSYPLDQSLDSLEKELEAQDFFRINRQMIVSRHAIGPMKIVSKSRVQIQVKPTFTEYEVIVSTERSPFFKDWLASQAM